MAWHQRLAPQRALTSCSEETPWKSRSESWSVARELVVETDTPADEIESQLTRR